MIKNIFRWFILFFRNVVRLVRINKPIVVPLRAYESIREKAQILSNYADVRNLDSQVFFSESVMQSREKFGADVYISILPSSLPAAFALQKQYGGKVFCDCVENVHVDKHSAIQQQSKSATLVINAIADGLLARVDGNYTVSTGIYELLGEYDAPRLLMPNYRWMPDVPLSEQGVRSRCGLSDADVILFASGNVVIGFESLLMALTKLPDFVHLACCVKISPAGYREKIFALIKECGIERRVHIFDFVPYAELPIFSASADIGVIISDVSNPNGAVAFPNRFFDFLAAGLPVVAPPMPDIVEAVNRCGFGVIVADGSVAAWQQALSRAVAEREKLRICAFKYRNEFSWASLEADFLDFLGRPRSVTFVSQRDLSRYQRFQRCAKTLIESGATVQAVFCSDHDQADIETSARLYRLPKKLNGIFEVKPFSNGG